MTAGRFCGVPPALGAMNLPARCYPWRMRLLLVTTALLAGCPSAAPEPADPPDPCAGDDALSPCLSPTMDAAYYADWSSAYFDSMDTASELEVDDMPYGELVARWEWWPWLKLTAYGLDNIIATDTLLRFYPSTIPERDCRFFDTQPFGRCKVVFYYEDEAHEGRGCPIYEEFTFNDAGQITWIEAWSDVDGLRPFDPDVDPWAETTDIGRLSTRIPGLGKADGLIDLNGEAMNAAASTDADVADFQTRANDWFSTWSAEEDANRDFMWEVGCGWEPVPE